MSEDQRPFASYLRFKEILADPLGHLYRAGEFDSGGVIRTVWLRVFDGPQVATQEIVASLPLARQISEKVQSTGIASGFDSAVVDGVPAIANEYVASKPLSEVFARAAHERFPVPVDNALLILEKISLALTATMAVEIQGERVVHGFLHPGLILVTNDGEGQVMGFGVAHHLLSLVDNPAAADLVQPYLAPEVLLTRTPSRQGDVYSLGAILFELLTGSPLPTQVGDRRAALDTANLGGGEDPLPEDIKGLLQRALAEQPDDRFSSATDFKKELDRLLYGGAYSPTTFNLALFMDRLFRAEIETEDGERAREQKADVTQYFEPAVETQPMMEEFTEAESAPIQRKSLWIGVGAAAAVVAAAAIGVVMMGRSSSSPPIPPTPTAAEIEAQREAQDQKMRELAESLVAEMMAEKEAEIREELSDRQAKIDELQKKLVASERRAKQGQLSRDEEKRRQDLQRQIAAEEEAQRKQEADLAEERQRAQEEARSQIETTVATEGGDDEDPGDEATVENPDPPTEAAPIPSPQPTALAATATPPPTEVPTPRPTPPPTEAPQAAPTPQTVTAVVHTNDFVDPAEVDTSPVLTDEVPVVWPRSATTSRYQGVVIMRALVNADGLAEEVSVLRCDHEGYGISQAAVAAALKYRFRPGEKNGVKIKTYATVTKRYNFVR